MPSAPLTGNAVTGKVIVTTPAGHVGSRVVRLLIQAGVRPTLLARHPARLDPATSAHADVIAADLGDAAAVVRATQGADALFWAEPHTDDPGADPVAWYTLLGANAARAVTETLRSLLRSAGLGDKQVEAIAGMSTVTSEDFTAEDKRSITTTTPTTLAAWAHAHLRPALLVAASRL
jgi:nucleoside-diphosphate-sugar epimerase